jgi:hypothetical protein
LSRYGVTSTQAFAKRMKNASALMTGLFNHSQYGDFFDGHKRSSVYMRQLCVDPFPAEDELLATFLEARLDVPEYLVKQWYSAHQTILFTQFRNRRNAFIRWVKDQIGLKLDCGKAPVEGGNPAVLKAWKTSCGRCWKHAKKAARADGLLYPEGLSFMIFEHVDKCEEQNQYNWGYVPQDLPPEEWVSNLVILEAFALNIIAVSFGQVASGKDYQCNVDTLGGKLLCKAAVVVLQQRAKYKPIEMEEE